jgi:DNA-binding NtrC family response regulator
MAQAAIWRAVVAQVLIAEDEPTVLMLAESIIAEMGHKTLSAANATQALALLDDESNSIDLLVTDIRMGDADQDGWQLAKAAVERRPGLRVLYTTGQTLTDGMRALFVDGAAFLPKPYDAGQLKDAITALLAQQPA